MTRKQAWLVAATAVAMIGGLLAVRYSGRALRSQVESSAGDVEVVFSPDELRTALATGAFDIVLADLADVERMTAPEERSPVLLPVVYKATWADVNRLKEAYRCVLNAPSRISQMLTVIEDAVKLSRNVG